ncbi:MAG: hypothetical protein U7123_07945 [Potamolinea sp.]
MLKTFSQHLELSKSELEALLALSLEDFLKLSQVNELLGSLDTNLLKQTLPIAGNVLAERLPPFYHWLQNELSVKRVPDSPDHTTKWVINFLNKTESLIRLVELHRPVPRPAIERSISHLVAAFDGVEDDQIRKEWQKAIAALCLVLIVAARDQERSLQKVA